MQNSERKEREREFKLPLSIRRYSVCVCVCVCVFVCLFVCLFWRLSCNCCFESLVTISFRVRLLLFCSFCLSFVFVERRQPINGNFILLSPMFYSSSSFPYFYIFAFYVSFSIQHSFEFFSVVFAIFCLHLIQLFINRNP